MSRARTEPVPTSDLRRGDVLDIAGLGPVTISGFRRIGPDEVLIKLSWFELCVTSHRDQRWRRVVTEPAAAA